MPDQLAETNTKRLEEMVERDPSTALYLPLAERLREEGRVEEAIRLCEARKNRPGHGVGDAVVLGRCYLADGRLNEARSAFEAALGLDRENVVALKALAGILAHEGRQARAIDLYRAVCRVDPGDLESQTALHQITSGEYADVSPADVVVGQGDLGWHPVRLPREEEHLSDLALGLRTIENFDEAAADPAREYARNFRELSLEELEFGTKGVTVPPSAAPPPEAVLPSPAPPEAAPATLNPDDAAPASVDPGHAAPGEAPRVPTGEPGPPREGLGQPAPESPPTPKPEPAKARDAGRAGGNRTAFEDWLRRLGGGA